MARPCQSDALAGRHSGACDPLRSRPTWRLRGGCVNGALEETGACGCSGSGERKRVDTPCCAIGGLARQSRRQNPRRGAPGRLAAVQVAAQLCGRTVASCRVRVHRHREGARARALVGPVKKPARSQQARGAASARRRCRGSGNVACNAACLLASGGPRDGLERVMVTFPALTADGATPKPPIKASERLWRTPAHLGGNFPSKSGGCRRRRLKAGARLAQATSTARGSTRR